MSRTYAVYDANESTASVTLELSSLQITPNVANTIAQSRSTLTLSAGKWWVEALFWGDAVLDSNSYIGIGTTPQDINNPIGPDPGGYTYIPATGEVLNDDTVLATFTAAGKNDIIGLAIDLDLDTLSVYVNGALIGSVSIIAGTYGIYGLVYSATEFDLHLFTNFGQRGTEYPAPADHAYGWYTETAAVDTLRLSTSSYTFPHDDPDIPDVFFDGRLSAGSSLPLTIEVKDWTEGQSGPSKPTYGTVSVLNLGGAYDILLSADYRDADFHLSVYEEGEPYSSREIIATGIVDSIKANSAVIQIGLRDRLSQLDLPIQTKLFLPNVAESAANQPIPVLLGTARNIDPVLYDEANLAYAIADEAVQTIAVVRDKADPLDTTVDPPDWTYNDTSTGFVLQNDPEGKITADASTTGGVGHPAPTDELGGIGNPFVDDAGDPDGWGVSSGTNLGEPYGADVSGTSLVLFHGPSSSVQVAAVSVGGLTIGNVYRARLTLTAFSLHAGSRGCTLFLRGSIGADTYATMVSPGEYVITFTAATTGFYVAATQNVAGGDSNPRTATVAVVTLEDVTAAAVSDIDAPLPGITLPDFAADIFEGRSGLTSADWSRASAEAVDAGQYDAGIFAREPRTRRAAIDAILDNYAGSMFVDRASVIQFCHWVAPEDYTSSLQWTFGDHNIVGEVSIELDLAPGLTNSIACRRNWSVFTQADFADDLVDVPLSLRDRFRRDFQFVRVSSVSLASCYAHAINAAPLESLIDDPDDAQAEIDRVCSIFTVPRYRIRLTALVTDAGENRALPGQICLVTAPTPMLRAGRYMQIRKVTPDPISGLVQIEARG